MERRNWSLKALSELNYIDSLDDEEKITALESWFDLYLQKNTIQDFDLELSDLKRISEIFYKNINFLKKNKDLMSSQLQNQDKIRKFFS